MCLKMRIFWKKLLKSPHCQGIRPQTHVGLRRLGALTPIPHVIPFANCYSTLSSAFSMLNVFYYDRKRTNM